MNEISTTIHSLVILTCKFNFLTDRHVLEDETCRYAHALAVVAFSSTDIDLS